MHRTSCRNVSNIEDTLVLFLLPFGQFCRLEEGRILYDDLVKKPMIVLVFNRYHDTCVTHFDHSVHPEEAFAALRIKQV